MIQLTISIKYLLQSRYLQLDTKGNIKMSITALAQKKLIIIYQVPVIESTLKNTVKEYCIRYQKTQLPVLAKYINHIIFGESLILFLFQFLQRYSIYLAGFLLRPNAIISQQDTGKMDRSERCRSPPTLSHNVFLVLKLSFVLLALKCIFSQEKRSAKKKIHSQ